MALYWARGKDSPVTFHPDGHTVHDFDRRFALEDEGFIVPGEVFRWKMLDEPLNCYNYDNSFSGWCS